MGSIGWLRESRVRTKESEPDHPLPVLRHTIVRSIHLSQVNAVASTNHGFKEVQNSGSTLAGQEALDVLEHERSGPVLHNELREDAHQGISVVAVATHSGRGEALAGRATDDDVAEREF